MAEGDLGVVIGGSLAEGLEMKLDGSYPIEALRAGRFVVVEGASYRFFSMITDVQLGAAAPEFLTNPPAAAGALERAVMAGTSTFGKVSLRPTLMLGKSDSGDPDLHPVKTIPPHFSPVREATAADVERVFGGKAQPNHFQVGAPLEMDHAPVFLDLGKLVERSNGIFGKSGTGKSFLTRICLCGILREGTATNLVFDMHSEYGWGAPTEDKSRGEVRGLKAYGREKVDVFSLDPKSTRRRGHKVEREFRIPLSQIEVEDIALLQSELNLPPTAVETGYLLHGAYGDGWLRRLIEMDGADVKAEAESLGAHPASLAALKRKLNVLQKQCAGFLHANVAPADDAAKQVLDALRQERHVVLEFGSYNKPLQYMLVANILTRRIHEDWVARTEKALGDRSRMPKPLVITIEEAHKFLAPGLAGQTIFGTIAREMRKFNVTLLIVDQRPSGIDDEILSQVGTKMICLLDDEKDVQAVLSGTPNAGGLRGVLAGLESKQQTLLLGHAVPMPVVIKPRDYDDAVFRLDMGYEEPAVRNARLEEERTGDFAE